MTSSKTRTASKTRAASKIRDAAGTIATTVGWHLPTEKTPHQLALPASMAQMSSRSQLAPAAAIDLPAMLAQLTKPLVPFFKRIPYRRHGPRQHEPRDILVPPRFAVAVVATGVSTPVA